MMASKQDPVPPDTESEGTHAPVAEKRRYTHYLLWSLLIPFAAWLAAFPLVTSKSYEQWAATEWGPVLEFPYSTGTPNADVVVFGDSSAFIGIDPRLVNAQLGIRSIVLPSTVGSLPVIGDTPLRTYLAHHKKPRLIVLYFSPWNLDFAHAAKGRHFEGEEMLLRHGSAGEIAHFMLRNPVELIAFPIRMYSTFGSKMLSEVLHHRSRAEDAFNALGHAPFLEPYPPLQDLCRIPSEYLRQYSDKTVQELKRRYESDGMRVMVYLAPIPRCTNSGAAVDQPYDGLPADPPALLPPPDFAGDRYYAHILPDAVPLSSRLFAAALQRALMGNTPERFPDSARDARSTAQTLK